MRARWAPAPWAAAAMIVLAGCSQSHAPSEEVEQAAEDVVRAVEGEPAQPKAGQFAPRNDCAEMPGAAGFLRELNEAIAARDADALIALAADDIKLDFGGGSGTAEFRRLLGETDGALWAELAELADLGCATNSQGGITLPWFFEQQLPVADPFSSFIVAGQNVPVYEAPGSDAPTIARLSWDVVELAQGGPEVEGYRHVRLGPALAQGGELPTGGELPREEELTGYVAEDALRSMVDYRLIAASRNGRWRIISLVSGD